jgi:basic secretory peptidase family protein/F5/8 type C domain-containing protein
MRISASVVAGLLLLGIPSLSARADEKKDSDAVLAVVESTLKTDGDHIRQFVLDGDAQTYFASDGNPTAKDSLTVVLDKPVSVKTIAVETGRPNGDDKLEAGAVEVSHDGKDFKSLAKFSDGAAKSDAGDQKVKAIRIHPSEDLKHPLVIREITIDSTPPVAAFKYPIEIAVNVSDAPDMKEWADKCARVCERAYPMISEELASDGFKPAHFATMTFKKDYRGVAATGRTRITGAVKWFTDHPDDIGAMVHETVHVVQAYGYGRGNPGWLVEGIADYIRFFKYEPGKVGRLGNLDRMHYNGSYRVTARFLDYVTEKYDKQLVKKLNAAMRQGKYSDELFKNYTGKTVTELDDEWRASLKKTT